MADVDQVLFVLIPVSFLGSVLNWSSFYSIKHLSSFNHSFGCLTANQALADAIHSTVFLLYFCPMVIFDEPFLKQYSHICGYILLFCYELSVLTHLSISFNRCISVWSPLWYEKVFSVSKTNGFIYVLWLYNLTSTLILYEKYCPFYFEEKIGFLTFEKSNLCSNIGWYGDFIKNSVIVTIVICLDLLTVIGVRKISKQLKSGLTRATIKKFSNRDRRFLKQTIIQGFVFMLELATYFIIPQYFTNLWIVFFGTSFAWVAVHVADGLIVFVCNPEIRIYMFSDDTPAHPHVATVHASSVVIFTP